MINGKDILIFNANPVKNSFGSEISKRYFKGAENSGATVEIINLVDLNFDIVLRDGFSGSQTLEDDIVEIQEKIKKSNHLVFVYPVWWGTYPALLKGFIDRVFLPGFAFKYRENSSLPEKLLTGKTARLITTMDTPRFYYSLYYKSPGHNSLRKSVLGFCGIKTLGITSFSPIKKSTLKQREKWLEVVEKLGEKMI